MTVMMMMMMMMVTMMAAVVMVAVGVVGAAIITANDESLDGGVDSLRQALGAGDTKWLATCGGSDFSC